MHQPHHWLSACCALFLLSLTGCDPAATTSSAPPKDTDAFKMDLAQAMSELEGLNNAHKTWGLGNNEVWDLDQDTGMIYFTVADGKKYGAPAQIIGTYSNDSKTWQWAWENPGIDAKLQRDALKLRDYGKEKKIDRLTKPKWPGTPEDAQQMVALAVKHCGAKGSYRGEDGPATIYITFGDIVLMAPEPPK